MAELNDVGRYAFAGMAQPGGSPKEDYDIRKTEPCGCILHRQAKLGASITYCPLHAAAPEMLEALEGALKDFETKGHSAPWWRQARQAIAHTRGLEVGTENLAAPSSMARIAGIDTSICEFCERPLDDTEPWRRGLDGCGAHLACLRRH